MSEEDPSRVSAISAENEGSRAGGRPGHKPTDDERDTVRRLVREGAKREVIAEAIGVSRATLRKHFAADLAKPKDQAGQLDLTGKHVVKPGSKKAAPGRPAFEPNYKHRERVQMLKAAGWKNDRIARRLKISAATLKKHFAGELADGADAIEEEALMNLRQSSRKGSVAASRELLKMTNLEPPPPERPKEVAAPIEQPAPAPEPAKLGKKEQQQREALDVPEEWHDLMSDDAVLPN